MLTHTVLSIIHLVGLGHHFGEQPPGSGLQTEEMRVSLPFASRWAAFLSINMVEGFPNSKLGVGMWGRRRCFRASKPQHRTFSRPALSAMPFSESPFKPSSSPPLPDSEQQILCFPDTTTKSGHLGCSDVAFGEDRKQVGKQRGDQRALPGLQHPETDPQSCVDASLSL